ncbi:MAG: FAD-binding protein [Acetobacteraceae bacterium]|nr:FAD-binding protein [Acetobacteraceae bacterium]
MNCRPVADAYTGAMTDEFDGIIVGGGAAGLAAALRATASRAHIALVDPDGGAESNLAYSGGLFAAAGTRYQAALGIADTAETWAASIRCNTQGAVDNTILQVVTSRSAELAHFLADHAGLDLHVLRGVTLSNEVPRLHATPGESGRELAALLAAAAHRAPSLRVLPREAISVRVESGRVTGIEIQAGPLTAPWILLASGGFGANRAMLARHAPEIAHALYIGGPGSDGRAIVWGGALGAEMLFMDSYQGQGHVAADGRGRLGPGLGSFGAIVVNAAGRRFADETMSPSSFAAHVLAQPGGWAVEVFDGEADQAARRFGPYREWADAGGVCRAQTGDALAAQLGLPGVALRESLAQVAQFAAGRQDPLGRTRHWRALSTPFLAAKITGALAHTQGGLRVDAHARVLRPDGTAIPGLLAAGGAAASISGHGAAGYVPGNGLAHAFVLGMMAGETMAGHG